MTIGEKMCREQGVATSIARSDHDNSSIIRAILSQYIAGATMWYALRTKDEWFPVESLPMNFAAYRYRVETLVEEE